MSKTPSRRAVVRACARFLKRLRQTGSVRAAAQAARVPRSSLYKWRAALPEFAADWAAAGRAVSGRRRPVPAPLPSPSPAPVPEWIEIPGQGLRHVSTLGRLSGGA